MQLNLKCVFQFLSQGWFGLCQGNQVTLLTDWQIISDVSKRMIVIFHKNYLLMLLICFVIKFMFTCLVFLYWQKEEHMIMDYEIGM